MISLLKSRVSVVGISADTAERPKPELHPASDAESTPSINCGTSRVFTARNLSILAYQVAVCLPLLVRVFFDVSANRTQISSFSLGLLILFV